MTRDDSVLARIAEMTKVSAEVVVGGAKSTKNVVFHSVQSVTHEETTTFVQMVSDFDVIAAGFLKIFVTVAGKKT